MSGSGVPVTACGGVGLLSLLRVAEVRRLAEVRMPEHSATVRNIAGLAVARVGRVKETGEPLVPFRLLDEQGAEFPRSRNSCTICSPTTPVRRR